MTDSLLPGRRRRLAGPLDDDDLLRQILLRLPPLPSSLPCAALVCERWRCLTSDTAFSKRFRIHHRRNPALLGFFGSHLSAPFEPTLEAPNRVPPVSQFTAKLWKREADSDSWELQRTIDLNKLLSLNLEKHHRMTLRFAEDNNLLVVGTVFGLFTVQLQSLKFKKLSENQCLSHHLPFESVYTGETGIGGGHGAPDLVQDT